MQHRLRLSAQFLAFSALLTACLAFIAPPALAAYSPQTIVFTPNSSNVDFPSLFTFPSKWPDAIAQTDQIEIATHTFEIETDAQISAQASFMWVANMRLDVIIPVQPNEFEGPSCTDNSAGAVQQAKLLGERLRRLKVPVARIVWDEPLTYGHYLTSGTWCQYSISQVAQFAADVTNAFRLSYPNIPIVDTEPLCGLNYQGSLPASECPLPSIPGLNQWLDDLKADLGDGVEYIKLDVQWHRTNWQAAAQSLVPAIFQSGMRYYGIYLDEIAGEDTTDAEYIAAAQSHMLEWAKMFPYYPPRIVDVASWYPMPSHLLPETNTSALTYLIDWYCALMPPLGGGIMPKVPLVAPDK